MGELKVPEDALYGAQTQRAINNFPVSGKSMPEAFVRALLVAKSAESSAVVMACDDAQIAQLNQDFRGKPQPTNVLSWPPADLSGHKPGGQPKRATDPE